MVVMCFVKVPNYLGFNFKALMVEDQIQHYNYRKNQFVSSDMYNIQSDWLKLAINKFQLRQTRRLSLVLKLSSITNNSNNNHNHDDDQNENKTDEDSNNIKNSTINDQALMKRKSKKFGTIGELMDDMYFEIHSTLYKYLCFSDHNTLTCEILSFADIYQSNELLPREILNGFIKKIHVSGDIQNNAPKRIATSFQ